MYGLLNLNHKDLWLVTGLIYSRGRDGRREMTGEKSPERQQGDSGCRCWVPKLAAKYAFAVAHSQAVVKPS